MGSNNQMKRDSQNIQKLREENSHLNLRIDKLMKDQENYKRLANQRVDSLEEEVKMHKDKIHVVNRDNLQHLREKLQVLQQAFVDLSDDYQGQAELSKSLKKKQKMTKKNYYKFKRENEKIGTRLLSRPTQPQPLVSK